MTPSLLFAQTPLLLAQGGAGAGGMTTNNMILIGVLIFVAILAIIFVLLFFKYFNLWIQAWLTGANVGIPYMIGMTLRKVNVTMLVQQKIALTQAGVRVENRDLEAHYLARGNVPKTAAAVIAAYKAGIDLPWKT